MSTAKGTGQVAPLYLMENTEKRVHIPTKEACEAHIKSTLSPRPAASHKGSFGRAHILAGSHTYTGAALLSAEGALRMGAGLTYLYTEREAAAAARARLPELIIKALPPIAAAGDEVASALLSCEGAILIGPGIGQTDEAGRTLDGAHFCELLDRVLSRTGGALVLDADALNLLARGTPDAAAFLRAAVRDVIITPHPTEFARLTGNKPKTQDERITAARDFAASSGATVVLKGAGTVIASPDGRVTVNPSGSPALAKGGTGDVLAGMLAALLAMGMPPYDAACAAVYLHGAAGDTLAATLSEYGVLPSELPAAAARELARIFAK